MTPVRRSGGEIFATSVHRDREPRPGAGLMPGFRCFSRAKRVGYARDPSVKLFALEGVSVDHRPSHHVHRGQRPHSFLQFRNE